MSELKPCPFCGGEGKGVYDDNGYMVECDKCHADGPFASDRYYKDDFKRRAIEAWNARAERTCRMEDNGIELCCSECDRRHEYDDEPDYCMGCGARVVD